MKKLFVFMLVCFVSVISCFGQEKKGYISDDKTAGGEISIFEQDGCNIVSFVYVILADAKQVLWEFPSSAPHLSVKCSRIHIPEQCRS